VRKLTSLQPEEVEEREREVRHSSLQLVFPRVALLYLYDAHYVNINNKQGTHFLDNRLTVGGKVVRSTNWPPSTLRKISGTRLEER
jgi:hypothetical protein